MWSKKYNLKACADCGRSDRPHAARKLCHPCYIIWAYKRRPYVKEYKKRNAKEWRENNKERYNEYQRKYQAKKYWKNKLSD